MLYFHMSERRVLASGLCGMTGCQFAGTSGWRGCVCFVCPYSPFTLLLSLIPWCFLSNPEHPACFWGLDVGFPALPSVLSCYNLQWEGILN